VELGFGTQDFALARQTLYNLSHTFHPFNSDYFGDYFAFLPRPAWTMMLLFFKLSTVTGITGMCHYVQLFAQAGLEL
jgi:hypothetical protein